MKEETGDQQRKIWDGAYGEDTALFGEEPSEPARKAANLFRAKGAARILELGAGQGRDSLFFAASGFDVHSLDYSSEGIAAIQEKAATMKLSPALTAVRHDVRTSLPFADESFDACYAHMLFCMALFSKDLESLTSEVRRVLKPGGFLLYTVRNTADPHYGVGIHRGEDMYETNGFAVHFFSREKIYNLSEGFDILKIEEFSEGRLPRRLFFASLRKKQTSREEGQAPRETSA